MSKVLFIGLGGAIGSMLRYGVSLFGQRLVGSAYPLGTLMVNISGCLAMGACVAWFTGPTTTRDEYRAAMVIGLLGGYTTFSAFGAEMFAFAKEGRWGQLVTYMMLTNGLGLIGIWAGYRVVRAIP